MHSKPRFIKLHPSLQAKSFNKINWIKPLEDFESLGPYMERFLSPENEVWIQQCCESAPQQDAFSRLLTCRSFVLHDNGLILGGEKRWEWSWKNPGWSRPANYQENYPHPQMPEKLFCYFYFLKNRCVRRTEVRKPKFRSEILAALG